MAKIKIGLADDHEFIRNSIANILNQQPDFEVVLQASNGKVLLELLEHIQCDIILMDICMPEIGGIEASIEIKQRFPTLKVIVFFDNEDENNIIRMTINGVVNFISRGATTEALLRALKIIGHGGVCLPDYAAEIIQRNLNTSQLLEPKILYSQNSPKMAALIELSKKELTILYHVADHLSVKEIADKMLLSPNTINNRQAELRKKLNLYGGKSLLKFALLVKDYLKEILSK